MILRDVMNSKSSNHMRHSINANDIHKIAFYYAMESRIYNAIYDKISEFSEFKCIITDRLHGMIFSLLSMTPCCVFDNKNHKVFGIVESWHLDKGVYKCVDYKDIDMFIDSKKKDYDKSSFDVIQYSVLNKLLFSI